MSETKETPSLPDFSDEEMHMPEDVAYPPETEPTPVKHSLIHGPILVLLIILLLLILAGLGYWYYLLNGGTPLTLEDVTGWFDPGLYF